MGQMVLPFPGMKAPKDAGMAGRTEVLSQFVLRACCPSPNMATAPTDILRHRQESPPVHILLACGDAIDSPPCYICSWSSRWTPSLTVLQPGLSLVPL